MSKQLATVVIDLDDVRKAGGVREAIAEFCEHSDSVACGVVGMEFATSGPGPGWSKQFGVEEWSREAFRGGAMKYLDLDDGRVRSAEAAEEDDEDALTDIGGCRYTVGDWSDESEVYVECPSEEDALDNPAVVAAMAKAVIEDHHALSDVKAWRQLIGKIKAAAEAFDDIDADELPAD